VSSPMRSAGRIALWFAAANFVALAVMIASLAATGAVAPASWRGALQVLRGTARSISPDEFERLRSAEARLAEREAMPEENVLVEGWRRLRAEKWRTEAHGAEQWARLALLAGFVEAERDRLERAVAQFRTERDGLELQRARRESELRMAASEKLRRFYRYMRPDSIAADLETRLDGGRPEEVAEIVKSMPERSAAEVLEAFADPAKRNRIYDLMSSAARGAAVREATP
jgi:flagellar motility protein MotE (MotC chaperone)